MKLSNAVSALTVFVSISLVALALGGCAADSDEPSEVEPVQVDVEDAKVDLTYVPRVTMKDINAGRGSCTTTRVCTINGTTWDCSGGGYCSIVR